MLLIHTRTTLQQYDLYDFRKPDWNNVERLSGTTYDVRQPGWVHIQFGSGPKWMKINNILVAYSAHGGTMVTLPVGRGDEITVSDFENMSHLLELSDCSLFDIAYFITASHPKEEFEFVFNFRDIDQFGSPHVPNTGQSIVEN